MQFKQVNTKPSFPKMEAEVLKQWQDNDTFNQSLRQREGNDEFIFYDGPPFPTGDPHHGTIFVSVLKDVIPRYKTMRGYHTPRSWGWDCHGLPIETQAEKNLNITDKREIESSITVATFNDECRQIVSGYNKSWATYIDKIGRWVDFYHPYRTLDQNFMESVIWAFSETHKKGLIYKDYRVSPYCYRCQTALSISDTRESDSTRMRQDRTITVKFLTNEANTFIIAWTTTPWTLPANLALAVGPNINYVKVKTKDKNGKIINYILAKSRLDTYELNADDIITTMTGSELAQKYTYNPIFNYFKTQHQGKILTADWVDASDGTGIVHIAPAFGEDDYWLGRSAKIGLVNPVNEQGCFTPEVTDYAGLNVHQANTQIIQDLKAQNIILKDQTIEHNYPHCWRCRTPLIYRAMEAWYLNVEKIKDRMITLNQDINWYPETIKNGRFGKWLAGSRDWNISRNRYWGTPIPVWECSHCDKHEVLGSVAEIAERSGQKITDLHKEFLDKIIIKCSCNHEMKRVPEVLDCWFESGSMPYAQAHYPFENKDWFEKNFPADFIVEYTGQIRGWFYVLHVLSTALFDRPAFKNCLVHGTLLTENGKKISKSLKNYTDPIKLLDEFGGDAMRAYLLSSPAVSMSDLAFRDEGLRDIIKILHLPLWNALVFFTTYATIDQIKTSELDINKVKLGEIDQYILSELEELKQTITKQLDNYQIDLAIKTLIKFLDTLNNWYIRGNRKIVWGKATHTPAKLTFYTVLHHTLSQFTLLLAPFCPFLSETVFQKLGHQNSIHLADWPKLNPNKINKNLSQRITTVREVISATLAVRAREKIKVRQPIAQIQVFTPINITKYNPIITEEVNTKKIEYIATADEIATQVIKVNARLLGPRLGKSVQTVIKLAQSGNFKLLKNGQVKIGDYTLEANEVEITYTGRSNMPVASINSTIVTINTELTPDLLLEGAMRDLIRSIQDLRRDAKLNISDYIQLNISGADEILKVYTKHIMTETLTATMDIINPILITKTIIIKNQNIIITIAKN